MVMRKCDFKTFNSSLPHKKGGSVNVPPQVSAGGAGSVHRWGIFKWPQVGEFGWPPGLESTEDTEKAQKLKDVLSNAGSLMDKRHKTIHSKWGRSGEAIDNANIIEQFGERGGKPYAQFTSAEKLEKLARQISQISSDLMNAIWPDGGPLSPWQRK
jgi:hypothetical protein